MPHKTRLDFLASNSYLFPKSVLPDHSHIMAQQEIYNVYPGESLLGKGVTSPGTLAAPGPIRPPQDWGDKYSITPVTYFQHINSAQGNCPPELGTGEGKCVPCENGSNIIQTNTWVCSAEFPDKSYVASHTILVWFIKYDGLTQCFPNCVP